METPTLLLPGLAEEGGKRKRRSRWGGETEKVVIPGLPTSIPSSATKDQIDGYLAHMRLEEIGRKLRLGDVVPLDGKRSPSPEPVYNSEGKRVNTREFRYRKKLEDERHKLIEDQMKRDPSFRPPADYKKPTKTTEKIFIPVKDYPEINFIGLLIGPRGNTLKKMEGESGAKISIRGKGSVKEGKGPSTGPHPTEDEDLHCLITADTEEKIAKAIKAINRVIETASSVPEGQNELKRSQLRELAALNGTLRDDEGQTCQNCGAVGHRKYDCPERSNVTLTLICRICGGAGHVARDCTQRGSGGGGHQDDAALDSEYANLMKELGENPEDGRGRGGGGVGHYGPSRGGDSNGAPPWANRGPSGRSDGRPPTATGAPPPWVKTGSAPITSDGRSGGSGQWQGSSGGPAPWASRGPAPTSSQAPGSYGGYSSSPGGNYGSQQQGSYGAYGAPGYGGQSGYGGPPGGSSGGYGGYTSSGYGSYPTQGYDSGYGYQNASWGQQPPPPPSNAPPPPPPSNNPPPPPPPSH